MELVKQVVTVLSGGCIMKRKTCFLLIAAVTLIAILGGCNNDSDELLLKPPIDFTGEWGDPTWYDGDVHSRGRIFVHYPSGQEASVTGGSSLGLVLPPVSRVFTVNPDWTFEYTGGFSQARQDLSEQVKNNAGGVLDGAYAAGLIVAWFAPPVRVEGTITYEGDGFYAINPKTATVLLSDFGMDDMTRPPDTVTSFEEYAKISYDADKLVIDDMPETVTNAKGILRGIWTKQ
jgi:hypothetical protein